MMVTKKEGKIKPKRQKSTVEKPEQKEKTIATSNSDKEERVRANEANKFTFEVAKHITTLDSGIILVFTSLNSNWITALNINSNIDFILIALGLITVATFLVSTISCVLVMFLIPYQLRQEKVSFWENWSAHGFLLLGLASFIAGILLIIIITFINLVY